MKRLTSAQKARRRGRNKRGGKTRGQRLREKINQKRRRLREKNLAELKFSTKPVVKHAEGRRTDTNDYAVYGIYEDKNDWVLTGLSVTDEVEKMSRDRTKLSETEIRGRYVLPQTGDEIDPSAGIELGRFDTKGRALQYVSADSSNLIEAGEYVVRTSHEPRTRREEVDKDDYHQFKRRARKVWE